MSTFQLRRIDEQGTSDKTPCTDTSITAKSIYNTTITQDSMKMHELVAIS